MNQKELQILYKDPMDGKFIEIESKTIPVILRADSRVSDLESSEICLAIKNNSNKIVSSIRFIPSAAIIPMEIMSCITEVYNIPKSKDYTSGISYTLGERELLQGESILLWIKAINIKSRTNYKDFSFDISYNSSPISSNDLKGFFEFTENYNEVIVNSSSNELSGTVINGTSIPVMRGIGVACLRSLGDRIAINTDIDNGVCVLFKGLIDSLDYDVPIISGSTFEFGIDRYRRPYIQTIEGTEYIKYTFNKILQDYNDEVVLSYSFQQGDKDSPMVYYNGVKVLLLESKQISDSFPSSPSGLVVGYAIDAFTGKSRQFIGDVNAIAIYGAYKQELFHTKLYESING